MIYIGKFKSHQNLICPSPLSTNKSLVWRKIHTNLYTGLDTLQINKAVVHVRFIKALIFDVYWEDYNLKTPWNKEILPRYWILGKWYIVSLKIAILYVEKI